MSRNNSRKRKTDLKTLVEVIFIILDAATLGTIFVFIGHDAGGPLECTSMNGLCKHDTSPLGTWMSMPSAVTELMGNTSYRGLLVPPNGGGSTFTGLTASLVVGCTAISNTAGAVLTLQYALFNTITETNSTNFQTTTAKVFIDGATPPFCSLASNLMYAASSGQALNATGGQTGYIFRVVGSGGGGTGDNPRFSSIVVDVVQTQERIFMPIAIGITTAQFNGFVYASIPETANTAVAFQWVATNTTAAGCTNIASVCLQHGSNTCTITVATNNIRCNIITVFGTAFGSAPNVVMTMTTGGASLTVPLGTISLLQAQTLTV